MESDILEFIAGFSLLISIIFGVPFIIFWALNVFGIPITYTWKTILAFWTLVLISALILIFLDN